MKTLCFRNPIITDERVAEQYTRDTIISDLAIMNGDNSTIEVRMLKTAKGIISGYFNDMDILCDAIMPYNGKNNIFFTLNPCPSTLAATMNQLQPRAKSTTKDAEITKRRWLIVDIDPHKPSSDMSSTSEEQDFALVSAVEIEAYLSANGFPSPVVANSGNGVHCLWAIDTNNDNESRDLIKAFLNALSDKFSNERIEVDRGMYNASRICKLYGTMATKGEDTAERPHRMSKIIDRPETIEIVSVEQIQAVTALLAPPQEQAAAPVQSHSAAVGSFGKSFDVEAFIHANNLDVVSVADEKDRKVWRLACPFKEHEDKAAFIQQFSNGAISAGCHHSKCTWGWHDLRAKFDPVYAQRQELRREATETQLPEHLIPYNVLLTAEKDNMRIDDGGNILILTGGKTPYWAKLSNFVPCPLEITYEIDGTDDNIKQTITKIGGWLGGTKELKPITVDTEKLFRGRWFIDLDFRAYINSDIRGGYDKIREIVQLFSVNAIKTTTYNHLGFRTIDDKLCFLHAGGAIGLENVSVNLAQNNLSGYELEDVRGLSAEDRRECIKKALKVMDIHRYGNVLFAYTFLAPLCDMFAKRGNAPHFSLWLYGKSDTGKSTVAALLLAFYGKGFSKNSLPMSFNDTENSLTKKLALSKDALAVIDDVVHPTAIRGDMNKQRKLSQNIVFNVANRMGRGRMNGDERLKKTYVPNGMVIFTAESPLDDIGESTTARLLSLELEKGSVNFGTLSECQDNTLNFNMTMGLYIEWLIANYGTLSADLQQKFEQLRKTLSGDSTTDTSKKLIEVCAFMHISIDCVLQYFIEAGAVEAEYKTNALKQLDEELQTLIEKQSAAIITTSPTKKFVDVIGNLLTAQAISTIDLKTVKQHAPDRNFVGWHDNHNYYFSVGENTGNVYIAVKAHYSKHDIPFDTQPKELYRRLVDEGIITDTDKGRYSKAKTINGKSERVLVIPKIVFNNGESTDEDIDDSIFE